MRSRWNVATVLGVDCAMFVKSLSGGQSSEMLVLEHAAILPRRAVVRHFLFGLLVSVPIPCTLPTEEKTKRGVGEDQEEQTRRGTIPSAKTLLSHRVGLACGLREVAAGCASIGLNRHVRIITCTVSPVGSLRRSSSPPPPSKPHARKRLLFGSSNLGITHLALRATHRTHHGVPLLIIASLVRR